MAANPFEKEQFQFHRDWEEALVHFLAMEAKNTQPEHWASFATTPETQKAAAFTALVLHGLLENKPALRESAEQAYAVYKTLTKTGSNVKEFEEWLRSGWLNLSRLENMLDAELRH